MQKEDETHGPGGQGNDMPVGHGHNAEMHLIYYKAINSPAWLEQKDLEQVIGNKTGNSESEFRKHQLPGWGALPLPSILGSQNATGNVTKWSLKTAKRCIKE